MTAAYGKLIGYYLIYCRLTDLRKGNFESIVEQHEYLIKQAYIKEGKSKPLQHLIVA